MSNFGIWLAIVIAFTSGLAIGSFLLPFPRRKNRGGAQS